MVNWDFCDKCGSDKQPITYDSKTRLFYCEDCKVKLNRDNARRYLAGDANVY